MQTMLLLLNVNIEATAADLPRLSAPSAAELPPDFGVVDGWHPSS